MVKSEIKRKSNDWKIAGDWDFGNFDVIGALAHFEGDVSNINLMEYSGRIERGKDGSYVAELIHENKSRRYIFVNKDALSVGARANSLIRIIERNSLNSTARVQMRFDDFKHNFSASYWETCRKMWTDSYKNH